MKNYSHVLMRLTDTPMYLSQAKLEVITENVLLPIVMGGVVANDFIPEVKAEAGSRAKLPSAGGKPTVGVVNVFEAMAARNTAGLSSMGTTYQGLRAEIESHVESGVTKLVLMLDTPGGEVTGLFSLTSYLRELRSSGIAITAIVDGMATSAGYAVAATADQILMTETSIGGSIAAIMSHLDQSKADEKNGYTYTIFRSKAKKALGDSHTPLTKESIDKFTAILDNADTAFNNDVIQSRPSLTLDAIVSMQGSEFVAKDCLSLGLCDAIIPSVDAGLAMAINTKPAGGASVSAKAGTRSANSSTNKLGKTMSEETTDIELHLALAKANEKITSLEAAVQQAAVLATTNERTRIMTIFDQSSKLGLSNDTALKMVAKGYDAEMSLDFLTTVAESKGVATALHTAGQSPSLSLAQNAAELFVGAGLDKLTELRAAASAAGFKVLNR